MSQCAEDDDDDDVLEQHPEDLRRTLLEAHLCCYHITLLDVLQDYLHSVSSLHLFEVSLIKPSAVGLERVLDKWKMTK
jgi:hypothetical protein